MASKQRAQDLPDKLWLCVLGLGLPLLGAFVLGADASWDLRNYHLYNPHAWLHARWAIDVAPAQLQSWHNPLPDLPLYLLVDSGLSAAWSLLWLALPACAAMLLVLAMYRRLCPTTPSRAGEALLALLVLGAAGFGSLLGIGSNDALVAAAMLGSLLLAISCAPEADDPAWQYAGLLAGAVAGLKPTALLYCLALAAAACCYGRWSWRGRALRLSRLAAGGLVGFALTYGWWGWHLYRSTGNPVFPYFNDVFASPLALALPYQDLRFLPASVADGLLSPLQLLSRSRRFSEGGLKDPRLLLGLLGFAGLWIANARRDGDPRLRARIALLLAFLVAGWLLWVFQYGIYRYALPLEMLGALALALLAQELPRWRAPALLAALLLVTADTHRPDWGRTHALSPRLGIPALALPKDALVVTAGGDPLAYLALGMPDDVAIVAVGSNLTAVPECIGLSRQAAQSIARHRGSFWLLADAAPGSLARDSTLLRQRYGLATAPADCRRVDSSIGAALLCPAARAAPATACARD